MVPEPATPSSRRYWQLPTFILGIVAMAAAYKQFPPPAASLTSQTQSAMQTVADAMKAKPPAWDSVRSFIPVLETGLDTMPVVDSPTAFLVGSWHIAAAEAGPTAEATSHWQQAARHFNRVDAAMLETADKGRLVYRQAKVDAQSQAAKPNETLFALLNAPVGEDTSERGRYVFDVAMRCTPPDQMRARAGLEEYLTGPGVARATQTNLAHYKLKLGKLFIDDGKLNEAKQWLEPAAGPMASSDVRASAHIYLAHLAIMQKNTVEAESRYRAALAVNGLETNTRGQVRLLCGEGLMSLDKINEAAGAFAQAAQEKGPIGVAASCRLAQCNARGPMLSGGRTADVDALEKCVTSIKPGTNWDNPHMGIEQVRLTFEDVIRACVTDGEVKSATRAAELYDRIAMPGRGKELKAETLMSMAYNTAKKADPSNKAGELAKAAAWEYDAMATSASNPAMKADALRKAADAMKLAGDKSAARDRLEILLATPGLSTEQMTSVRMDLADCTTDPAKVATMMQQVVEAGGAQAYTARVKLACAQIERAKDAMKENLKDSKTRADSYTSAAVTLLEQAAGATTVSPLDQPAHELALCTLGRVKMERGQFAEAVVSLKTMMQLYPAAKDGERAKLNLGSSLLVEGTTGSMNPARLQESLTWLEPLVKSEVPTIRSQAGVRVARAKLAGKQWQEAVTAAMTTADDARGTIEELIALSLAYNGFAEQTRTDQIAVIEKRMRTVFTDLPDTIFTGAGPEYTRSYWQTNWFDWLDKKAKP